MTFSTLLFANLIHIVWCFLLQFDTHKLQVLQNFLFFSWHRFFYPKLLVNIYHHVLGWHRQLVRDLLLNSFSYLFWNFLLIKVEILVEFKIIHVHSTDKVIYLISFRITEYAASDRLCRDIQSQIVLRNREPRLSTEYSKISSGIRFNLKQFSTNLEQLNSSLTQSAQIGSM